ncbi:MAG: hypothetical protein NT157_05085 [Candidatus Micrarchaeota archaeon]|nr:hypothetical protein [Candidatus Micrarchaeota archaeon]
MVCARATAPTKVILFGEHYVVYGSPAIVVPVDRRNEVVVTSKKGSGNMEIRSMVGGARIKNGIFSGVEALAPIMRVYERLAGRADLSKANFDVEIVGGGAPKGMGNSSSVFAAFAAGMYSCLEVDYDEDELFECAQSADMVAHGGMPSGIDARVVVSGSPLVFARSFKGSGYEFKKTKLMLPKGCSLVVVDTFRGKRQTTGELVRKFAAAKGIGKKPEEMSEEERKEIAAEVAGVLETAIGELKAEGDARKLGEAMNLNQELLARCGVSTEAIEEARRVCLGAGAYGAKLTGAGGVGGAAIALVDDSRVQDVIDALAVRKFPAFKTIIEYSGVVATRS